MRSVELSWSTGLSALMVAACVTSGGTGTGSTADVGDVTASVPAPASLATAPGEVIETTLEMPVGLVGPIDVARSDVSVRNGPSGTAVKVDVLARALETIDTLQLDYCGPTLTFVSVDGSTVVGRLENDILHAPLHSRLEANTEFTFRFLTVVPLDHVAQRDAGDVAAHLLCR